MSLLIVSKDMVDNFEELEEDITILSFIVVYNINRIIALFHRSNIY